MHLVDGEEGLAVSAERHVPDVSILISTFFGTGAIDESFPLPRSEVKKIDFVLLTARHIDGLTVRRNGEPHEN